MCVTVSHYVKCNITRIKVMCVTVSHYVKCNITYPNKSYVCACEQIILAVRCNSFHFLPHQHYKRSMKEEGRSSFAAAFLHLF